MAERGERSHLNWVSTVACGVVSARWFTPCEPLSPFEEPGADLTERERVTGYDSLSTQPSINGPNVAGSSNRRLFNSPKSTSGEGHVLVGPCRAKITNEAVGEPEFCKSRAVHIRFAYVRRGTAMLVLSITSISCRLTFSIFLQRVDRRVDFGVR